MTGQQPTLMKKPPYALADNKVIIDYSSIYCETPARLMNSDLLKEVVERWLKKHAVPNTPASDFLQDVTPESYGREKGRFLVDLFRLLVSFNAKEAAAMVESFRPALERREELHQIKEDIYNYWRRLERFAYMEVPARDKEIMGDIHYAHFIKTNEELKNLVLFTHRKISENLMETTARVFRQLPAWVNMGMLVRQIEWACPEPYRKLQNIPFVRHMMIDPPLILYPKANTRKGAFEEIADFNPDMLDSDFSEWFCIPLKVADLIAFVYFKRNFTSLALSMGNLFDLVDKTDLKGKKPDLMIVFGVEPDAIPHNTVFYHDKENDMHVGLIRDLPELDYFGYFKKMTLTLHNLEMIRRGHMPLHGAMVAVRLKMGGCANVAVVGDSGAGKSETLEALRNLAEDYILDMKIIFDDMGSLRIDKKGTVRGYGTEIGAFVRLDDLSPGYAYEEIDRSIFMNPHKQNARLIIPVSPYDVIVKGTPVDMLLYANNYDTLGDETPAIEFFDDAATALEVFRSGARMAKGTTDEKGLVHTYFANPFGAPQRREQHEAIAEKFFTQLYETGVQVGQMRTRLGIAGMELEGPKAASMELFEIVKKLDCRT